TPTAMRIRTGGFLSRHHQSPQTTDGLSRAVAPARFGALTESRVRPMMPLQRGQTMFLRGEAPPIRPESHLAKARCQQERMTQSSTGMEETIPALPGMA